MTDQRASRTARILLSSSVLVIAVGMVTARAEDQASPKLNYRAVLPSLSRAEVQPSPTPAPRPEPYRGPVETLYLHSAGVTTSPVVEQRDTAFSGGREVFEDPSEPAVVAWYPRFGRPGSAGQNSIFAAHVNYIGYGNGPFAFLTSTVVGDLLVVTMDNGDSYIYTVRSVEVISLDLLNMDAVVFPALDGSTERVTLISCGGTFVPNASGGGEYNSRVIVVAERVVL